MTRITQKAAVYIALAVAGMAFAAYSIKMKNYILLAVSAVFALVSADNIFCNVKNHKS
ncbi:hypothetical protein HYV80_00475 [Candidatus Woesearchaeota archaeon]|nr:hypothetical protein [Candidatus Woesearchaeota archaeon]